MSLLWWHDALVSVDAASRLLQSKTNDLFIVTDTFKKVTVELQKMRNEERFQEYIQKATGIWQQAGFSNDENGFCISRIRRVKRMVGEIARDDAPINAKDNYRSQVFYNSLDSMIGELSERTHGLEEVTLLFGFLQPQYLSSCTRDDLGSHAHSLSQRFPTQFSIELGAELHAFKTAFFPAISVHPTVSDYLRYLVETQQSDVYPELEVLLRLFLTLPIGIASAERAFSLLKRVKTYLRNTMGQQRLTDLSILAIEKEIAAKVDLSAVIAEFTAVKARRGIRM
jgi:hypothetical protein